MKHVKHNRVQGLPLRPSSKRKEAISISRFEQVIEPWMVKLWESHDYGVDASVEITRPLIDSEDEIVTGKRFSVQIKATSSSIKKNNKFVLRVPTVKIRYWYNSIEPVLLVRYDIRSGKFHYIWIDNELISTITRTRPKWVTQKTVTLEIPKKNELSQRVLHTLEEYILNWRRPPRFIMEPGNYFRMKEEMTQSIQSVKDLTKILDVTAVTSDLEKLLKEVNDALYVIAITGPTRAGKSTLLNAIVAKNISPVGILPTTGIPLAIVPGEKNVSEVVFKEGTKKNGSAKSDFLRQFVSQEENPDNYKNVKFVTVKLVSDQLEKGISFYDVPGLDDPDENVRSITVATLYSANAIIYVINAAPMKDGGFALTKQIVDDLRTLGPKMDRLFLVFNKTDVLDEYQIKIVREYVNKTLKKYEIDKYLPVPPLFLSAKRAFENRRAKSERQRDSVTPLEDSLWDYLLSQNKNGLYTLLNILLKLKTTVKNFVTIINARLIDSEQREILEKQISQIRDQLPELQEKVTIKKNNLKKMLTDTIETNKNSVLTYLENELKRVPLNQILPSSNVIRNFLEKEALSSVSDIRNKVGSELGSIQIFLNDWIEKKLLQVRMTVEERSIHSELKLPIISELIVPISEDFSGTLGMALVGGLGGLIFGPLGALVGFIFGGVFGLFLTAEQRRGRQINTIMARARKGYLKVIDQIHQYFQQQIDEVCKRIVEQTTDRVSVFLGEMSSQMRKLDTPLTVKEKDNFRKVSKELFPIENQIDMYITRIREYTG